MKGRLFGKRKLQGLNLTVQILNIIERIIDEIIAVWFDVRMLTANNNFYLETVTGEIFSKKDDL